MRKNKYFTILVTTLTTSLSLFSGTALALPYSSNDSLHFYNEPNNYPFAVSEGELSALFKKTDPNTKHLLNRTQDHYFLILNSQGYLAYNHINYNTEFKDKVAGKMTDKGSKSLFTYYLNPQATFLYRSNYGDFYVRKGFVFSKDFEQSSILPSDFYAGYRYGKYKLEGGRFEALNLHQHGDYSNQLRFTYGYNDVNTLLYVERGNYFANDNEASALKYLYDNQVEAKNGLTKDANSSTYHHDDKFFYTTSKKEDGNFVGSGVKIAYQDQHLDFAVNIGRRYSSNQPKAYYYRYQGINETGSNEQIVKKVTIKGHDAREEILEGKFGYSFSYKDLKTRLGATFSIRNLSNSILGYDDYSTNLRYSRGQIFDLLTNSDDNSDLITSHYANNYHWDVNGRFTFDKYSLFALYGQDTFKSSLGLEEVFEHQRTNYALAFSYQITPRLSGFTSFSYSSSQIARPFNTLDENTLEIKKVKDKSNTSSYGLSLGLSLNF